MRRATDRCPRCGERADGHRFCGDCGHDLWLRKAGAPRPPGGRCPGCGDGVGTSGVGAGGEAYCGTCGVRRPDGTEHVEADLGLVAGVSDRGLVHARNEDAMALGVLAAPGSQTLVAAVVCDGVSASDTPELASRAAADAALERLLHPGGPDVAETVAAAAAAVAAVPGGTGPTPPACTLVAAVVGESGEVTVTWVGDSRAYWLPAPGSGAPPMVLTHDHSWAAEVVAAGLLDEAAARRHPRAHAITRWLGDGGDTEGDVVTLRPDGPGLLLLCTDGLWNDHADPAALAALALPPLARGGPLAAARALTAAALHAGGRDNVTVAAIPIGIE